ncbi:glutathione hydrolase 1 proenzyme-like isoform X2 [Patiria miniata]|uniref:Gamma-glutamyltranspeptidase 1 n=1 Tax=Patiria miniata TaxID=46514 RepID=A0A914A6N5_PATMI|nr:glutathione hydrolase 1 proenzyme-like isoform X2 [Patiria miniata]
MYIFAIARRTSTTDGTEASTSAGTNQAAGMENDGYQNGDETPKHDSEPTTKTGEPQGYDDVDLSISAHQQGGKTKYDVEAAGKKKSAKNRTEDEHKVPSYWFIFMVVLLGVGFFLALGLGLGLGHPDPKLKPYQFFNGAVASDRELCSRVGRDLMLNGGNALDAAIGTSFCVGVLNLHVGGVGGGGYLTFYNKTGTVAGAIKTVAVDGQVVAPSSASMDMFSGQEGSAVKGGMAIAIPGQVAGLFRAHKNHGGTLSWASLVEPSIRLAKGGFEIGEALAKAIKDNEDVIRNDTGLSEIFLTSAGGIKQQGDEVTLPKLAATLETIASQGADGFYKGDLANMIVDDVNEMGGNISLADLEEYEARSADTVSIELGGGQLYDVGGIMVYAPPPPSSGILTNYILNILEGYSLSWRSTGDTSTEVETYHRMLESFKFALAEHSRLGDPEFEDSVKEVMGILGRTSTATTTRGKIQTDALQFLEYGSMYAPKMDPAGGATHISVKDGAGNAVSYTSSLSLDFGAKKRGTRTGIIFNAGMGDFTLPDESLVEGLSPSPVNSIQPGKRPLSSMSPLVLVDKDYEVKAVIGSSGGLEMITATAMMAAQTVWFEHNVIDAMERARFSTDLGVDSATKSVTYNHEASLETGVVNGLSSRGQIVNSVPLMSSVNYIMQTKKNRWYTNSDTRAPGSGYAHY